MFRFLAGENAAAPLNGLSTGWLNPDCGFELMKIGRHHALRFAHLRPSAAASARAHSRGALDRHRRFHPLATRTSALRVWSIRQMSIKMHNICG
jgi:hypothetical protein